jgi:hypothetical protein
MNRTRDLIQEMVDVRARRQYGSAMAELPFRLLELEHAFRSFDKSQRELARYFPVALVASIEGFFRMAIRDLIDAGEPYLSNAEKAASTVKLDYSLMRAVHGRQITIGELVAHSVPISRIEHIDAALSTLIGFGFLKQLRSTVDRWKHDVQGKPPEPMLSEPDDVYEHVARTFQLRHIICHEIASAFEVDLFEIEVCFESCVKFLRAANELISDTLHPGAPLTQTDMNITSYNQLLASEEKLSGLLVELQKDLEPEGVESLQSVHRQWSSFCDAWVAHQVGRREDSGTIWPLVHNTTRESLVLEWQRELERHAKSRAGEA